MLEAIAASPVAAMVRDSAIVYPLVNATHILGLGLLLGAIVTLDLRLLGAFAAAPVGAMARPLGRVAAAGLAVATASGALLFSTRPAAYVENPAFLLKLALVGLGVANALRLRASAAWREARAGRVPPVASLRAGAALSLTVWVAAVFAGRWIGFLQ